MALGLAVRQFKQATRGIETWGGGLIAMKEESFEDRVKRIGAVSPVA